VEVDGYHVVDPAGLEQHRDHAGGDRLPPAVPPVRRLS
jgi:hypothetical protein